MMLRVELILLASSMAIRCMLGMELRFRSPFDGEKLVVRFASTVKSFAMAALVANGKFCIRSYLRSCVGSLGPMQWAERHLCHFETIVNWELGSSSFSLLCLPVGNNMPFGLLALFPASLGFL